MEDYKDPMATDIVVQLIETGGTLVSFLGVF